MLTLTFLGVGGAFAKRNFQSNALVEAWSSGPGQQFEPDDTLLVDFGGTGPLALHQLKDRPGFEYLNAGGLIAYPKVRRIFITHLHADHIGGLEELASMNTYVFNDADTGLPFRPQLIGAATILARLWDSSLKGGLGIQQGRHAALEDYFRPLPLDLEANRRESFPLLERYRFEPFPTHHLHLERKYDWPSFGLRMIDEDTGESAVYTGDSQCDFPAYEPLFTPARLCFHDVQLFDASESVHAPLSELRALPPAVKKKMILFHYGDDWDSPRFAFISSEFAGFATPQHRYVLFG